MKNSSLGKKVVTGSTKQVSGNSQILQAQITAMRQGGQSTAAAKQGQTQRNSQTMT